MSQTTGNPPAPAASHDDRAAEVTRDILTRLVNDCDQRNSAEKTGFEVRDVESLREHYALTLRNWVHNLE